MDKMNERLTGRMEQFCKEVRETGEELREAPVPPITQELFDLYEKTGNRLKFERVYFLRRKFLVTFGLLSIWDKKKEDIEKLAEVIEDICRETSWALPAHVDVTQEGWEHTVDLFACETGQTLSELSWLLGDRLPEAVRVFIREQVITRLLDSFLSREEGGWKWEHYANNWIAVCGGCLGAMAIYLLGDQPEKQTQCIQRTTKLMDGYLAGMKDDGTCPEGLSYFTYGMSYFTGFADLLKEHTKGQMDLMENPKVEAIAKFQQLCYFSGGKTVSFSDGSQNDRFRMGLTSYLAGRYDGVRIPDISAVMNYHTDSCYRFMALYRELIWTRKYLEERSGRENDVPKEHTYSVLPDAQWVIGKGMNGSGMAVKGGDNDEPHNHNDIGSLIYIWNGDEYLTDLGCGEYCRDYFYEKRYTILCNRSLGHSVPLINGQEQLTGSQYQADDFLADQEQGYTEISFGAAYEHGSIETVRRRVEWTPEGMMTVRDRFVKSPDTVLVEENLVTQMEPAVDGEWIRLSAGEDTVCIHITTGSGVVRVKKECFINHNGEPEDVWLIQWTVPSDAQEFECHFQVGEEGLLT